MTREELAARLYTEAADILVTESNKISGAVMGGATAGALGGIIADAALKEVDRNKLKKARAEAIKLREEFRKGNITEDELEEKRIALSNKYVKGSNKRYLAAKAAVKAGPFVGSIIGAGLKNAIERQKAARKAVNKKTVAQLDKLIKELEEKIARYESKSATLEYRIRNRPAYKTAKLTLKKAKAARNKLVKESIDEFGDEWDYITEETESLVQENNATSTAATIGGTIVGDRVARKITSKLHDKNWDRRENKMDKLMHDRAERYRRCGESNWTPEDLAREREYDKEYNATDKKIETLSKAITGPAAIAGGVAGNKLNKIIENYIAAKKATAGKTAKELDGIIDKLEAFIKKYEDKSTDPAWKKTNKAEYSKSKAILKKAKAERARLVKESVDEFGDEWDYITESPDLLVQENKATSVASTVGGAIAGSHLGNAVGTLLQTQTIKNSKKKYNKLRKQWQNDEIDDDEFTDKSKAIQKKNKSARDRVAAIQVGGIIAGGIAGNRLNKIIENYVAAKKATDGKTANELDTLIDKLEAFIKKYEDNSTDPAWKKANKAEYSKSKAILKKAKAQRASVVKESVEDNNYIEESYNGLGSVFDQLDNLDFNDFD